MAEASFCESCGNSVPEDAKFCERCGTARGDSPSGGAAHEARRRPAGGTGGRAGLRSRQAAERIEAFTPGASELASQLTEQLRTPAVATALIGGAVAAAAVFAIGLVLALLVSDQSLIGSVDAGKGVITGGFAQMLNFLQVSYGSSVGKLGPALFLVFPVAACAVAAASQAARTGGLSVNARLVSGAGIGLTFGLLMLIPALASGGLGGSDAGTSAVDPSALGAVVLGVLWGMVGGLAGTYYVVRADAAAPLALGRPVSPAVTDALRTVFVALRPLALLLVVMTVAGAITWTAETLLKSEVRAGRSTLVATLDDAAYSVEHGVHWAELGALAQFRPVGEASVPVAAPVPVGDPSKIKTDALGRYRIFGFNNAIPAYTFIPLLLWVIGIPLLLALNAGFAIVRLRRPPVAWQAAAWGALVGPIWALTMVLINAFVTKDAFGRASGDSVFGVFLLGGLVLGAIGGLLGDQRQVADVASPRRAVAS
jgi:hypothetical protein